MRIMMGIIRENMTGAIVRTSRSDVMTNSDGNRTKWSNWSDEWTMIIYAEPIDELWGTIYAYGPDLKAQDSTDFGSFWSDTILFRRTQCWFILPCKNKVRNKDRPTSSGF